MTEQQDLSWYPRPDGTHEYDPAYNGPHAWKAHGPTDDWQVNKRKQERKWHIAFSLNLFKNDPSYDFIYDGKQILRRIT